MENQLKGFKAGIHRLSAPYLFLYFSFSPNTSFIHSELTKQLKPRTNRTFAFMEDSACILTFVSSLVFFSSFFVPNKQRVEKMVKHSSPTVHFIKRWHLNPYFFVYSRCLCLGIATVTYWEWHTCFESWVTFAHTYNICKHRQRIHGTESSTVHLMLSINTAFRDWWHDHNPTMPCHGMQMLYTRRHRATMAKTQPRMPCRGNSNYSSWCCWCVSFVASNSHC